MSKIHGPGRVHCANDIPHLSAMISKSVGDQSHVIREKQYFSNNLYSTGQRSKQVFFHTILSQTENINTVQNR